MKEDNDDAEPAQLMAALNLMRSPTSGLEGAARRAQKTIAAFAAPEPFPAAMPQCWSRSISAWRNRDRSLSRATT